MPAAPIRQELPAVSLYHYRRLTNNNRLNPTTVGVDLPWWADHVWEELPRIPEIPLPDPPPYEPFLPMYPPPLAPQNVISMIGTLTVAGQVEMSHVARTSARPEVDGAEPTAMVARLLDNRGEVLAEAPVLRLAAQGCGRCGCGGGHAEPALPYVVQALIPDVAPGAALEVRAGEKVLWERAAPRQPARVGGLEVSISGQTLNAAWRVRGEMVEGWLRWSSDGELWQSLATGLKGDSAAVDAPFLPPGRVLVQLVAHDGFFSNASTPVVVVVPGRVPDVAIFHPREGHTYLAGQTIRLWCAATHAQGSTVAGERCVWSIDGKEIGRGRDVWIKAPRAGDHVVSLRAADEHGEAETKVAFKTVMAPKAPSPRRG